MTTLHGDLVTLRPVTTDDIPALAAIRDTPQVKDRWWSAEDTAADLAQAISDEEVEVFVIMFERRVAGMIQWSEEQDPQYRHAGIDLYVDPAVHGKGVGTDAVRTLARHLIRDRGQHRLVIDPAADNAAAIRAYSKVGFRPVGTMRQYELGPDGTWHDGLLMDLLADELT